MPIFDQGYQHWKGPLTGHAWRWWTITRHGVRVQLQNRLLRLLMLVSLLPAVGLVVALAVWGLIEQKSVGVLAFVQSILPADMLGNPTEFRSVAWTLAYSTFFQFQIFFIMLMVVIAGPGLISRDLRFNALPMYLSRPVTRLDYFLGKMGVIAALVAFVAVVPAVFAYVVGVFFSLDLSVVRDTYKVLLCSVAYGVLVTVSVGTLILAMSSLTRRSLYVGIAFAAMWIISGAVGSAMTNINRESVRRGYYEEELDRWLAENPPPAGVQMSGRYPVRYYQTGRGEPKTEVERWHLEWAQASSNSWMKANERKGEGANRDWRPLLSYVTNLERFADLFLDTESAWVAVAKASEKPRAMFGPMMGGKAKTAPVNERRLADENVKQYPWEWSAGVLAALLGLSVWTLSRRVKSLDRLK